SDLNGGNRSLAVAGSVRGRQGEDTVTMRRRFLARGALAVAAVFAFSGAGVVSFAEQASAATPSITVTPSTGIQTTGSTPVTVSASGFAPNSAGAILECNSDPAQPTVVIIPGTSAPVSCGPMPLASGATNLVQTDGSGGFSAKAFTVTTGTVGPPVAGTDSAGNDAATDASKYPCPPTAAQQAAGDHCVIAFGDASGNQATQNLTFAGPCLAPANPVGYDFAAADGGVFTFGNLPFCGSAG